jgi:hypothetical protein
VRESNRTLRRAAGRPRELVAGRLPDGSANAEVMPDGAIVAKLGWWRAVEGQLSVEGERLDASAPPLRADIPLGTGPPAFSQPNSPSRHQAAGKSSAALGT